MYMEEKLPIHFHAARTFTLGNCCTLFCLYLIKFSESLVPINQTISIKYILKGTQMGPLLIPVSPCFRENVIVICKIVFFV